MKGVKKSELLREKSCKLNGKLQHGKNKTGCGKRKWKMGARIGERREREGNWRNRKRELKKGKNRKEQDRTGKNRTGPDKRGQDETGQGRKGQGRIG